MTATCGKWLLVSCDSNFGDYMDVVGVTPENKTKALAGLTPSEGVKLYQTIERDGSTWVVTISSPAGEKSNKYVDGKATDVHTLDNREVSVVYTVEGDDLVETQTGKGFTSRNVRHVEGDKMTMTFTSGSVSCARTYQKCS